MKTTITTTVFLILLNFNIVKANGPIIKQKLSNPDKEIKQTLQKRAFTWITGQWKFVNNKYEWIPAHWTQKKMGYVFIGGKWIQKNNGWIWQEGYWKKINMKKWMILYN